MCSFRRKLELIVLATGTVAIPLVSKATTATWTGGGTNTNWDTSGNWNASEPNNIDDVAIFNTYGVSANLDVPVTLGVLDLNANTTIGGTNTLTMQSADQTSPGILPAINLTGSGTTATISAPISYVAASGPANPQFVLDGASGTTLNLNGSLTASTTGAPVVFQGGNFNLGLSSTFNTASGVYVGALEETATLNINGTVNDSATMLLGSTETTNGYAGIGVVNQYGGNATYGGTLRDGQGLTGGYNTANYATNYVLGVTAGEGTYNISGGTLTETGTGGIYVGSQGGTGTMNVTGASTVVAATAGGFSIDGYAGPAPYEGGSGNVTLTDGTINVDASMGIGQVNPTAPTTLVINGSTSTSGGRLTDGGDMAIATGNSSSVPGSNGDNVSVTIEDGGTATIATYLDVGNTTASYNFLTPNEGTFTISGTTPAPYTAKLTVGTFLLIGNAGATGTFTANESDTAPINIGTNTATNATISLGTVGSVTDSGVGTTWSSGNGTMTLEGATVVNFKSDAPATTNIIQIANSNTNSVTGNTNVGGTGLIQLMGNAVFNVNSVNASPITIGNGVNSNTFGSAGSGTLSLANNSQFNLLNGGSIYVGYSACSGYLTVADSAELTMSGSSGATLYIGAKHNNTSNAPGTASLALSGTTSEITVPNMVIGQGVPGSASVSGGTLDVTTGGIILGENTNAAVGNSSGNGTLTVTGGTVETPGAGGNLILSNSSDTLNSGTLNLQGGVTIIGGSLESNNTANPTNSVVNFTGGELQAGTIAPANFVSSVSQSALPVALQQTSNALVQSNTDGASLLHAASQNLAISGGYVLLGGAAQADSGQTISVSGLTSVNTGVIQGAGTFSTNATSGFGINGTLTVSGPGIVNLNGPSSNQPGASLIVNGGTVNVSSASSTPSTVTIGTSGIVNLNGSMPANATATVNGQLNLAPNLDANVGVITLGSLSVGAAGIVDITNNKLFITYSSPATDPIASIAAWIHNGFYDLSGPQIMSSAIAADDAASGLSYGIGYADGADGEVAGLPSGEIEIMFTLLGDANLDGTVNSEDFTPFSTNANRNGGWDQGDFNYDGTVNSEDFTPFSHNLNQSASLASAGVLETVNGDVSLSNVPEPTTASLLTVGTISVLARRRRRHAKAC